MLRAEVVPKEKRVRVAIPRKSQAIVRIQFQDFRRGESLTLNLHRSPWPNRFICEHGQFSAEHLGKAIKLMLIEP